MEYELGFEELLGSLLDNLKEPENLKLPNPSLILFYQNLKNRKIWIDDDISELQMDYEKYIIYWNKKDEDIPVNERKPIYLYIYTRGGDLDFANSLIDLIKMSETPIYTINMGKCMSAGALIFLAGTKRFVMPKSQILIHQGSILGMSGTTSQVIENIDNIKKNEQEIKKYILENSKIDSKLYNKNSKKEWFLTAEEAIEYGVADEIIYNIKQLY